MIRHENVAADRPSMDSRRASKRVGEQRRNVIVRQECSSFRRTTCDEVERILCANISEPMKMLSLGWLHVASRRIRPDFVCGLTAWCRAGSPNPAAECISKFVSRRGTATPPYNGRKLTQIPGSVSRSGRGWGGRLAGSSHSRRTRSPAWRRTRRRWWSESSGRDRCHRGR